MSKNNLACVILAAGMGTRMKSDIPKVLHPVAQMPMIQHVIRAAEALNPEKIITVIGPDMEDVAEATAPHPCAIQHDRLGSAHAVLSAKDHLQGFHGDILILYGDCPLVTPETLHRLVKARQQDNVGIANLAMTPDEPGAYGRMLLNEDGTLNRIVEFAEASVDEKNITLCNAGLVCVDGTRIWDWLSRIHNHNSKGEYYLTDMPAIAAEDGVKTIVVEAPLEDTLAANNRAELAVLEETFQNRMRRQAMEQGATLVDPKSVFFSADTQLGRDVIIGPNVVFGPGVIIGDHVTILPFSHLEGVEIERNCRIGPFARLRPGTWLGENVHIGNFVELKSATVEPNVKAMHLSYLGNINIGQGTNIGAGTITCNYDGFDKFQTEIGQNAFIGSDSALVAPVKIGDGAFVAAGSVITEDVEDNSLGIARGRMHVSRGWANRFREQKKKLKQTG